MMYAGEHTDLAASNPDVVAQLWAVLNQSIAYQRDCNGWSYDGTGGSIPGPKQSDGNSTSCSPPARLGFCNPVCANARWKTFGMADGPYCDVPTCNASSPLF